MKMQNLLLEMLKEFLTLCKRPLTDRLALIGQNDS